MNAKAALLAACCAAYAVSQFFRTALGVVAPEIAQDLTIGADRIGALSAVFFWSFAAAQIPIGVLLDRHPPHRVIAVMMLAVVAGAGLFAVAPGYGWLVAAQILIGIGCGPILMGSYVMLARLWPPAQFALLAGVIMTLGNFGNLAGTTPLALLAEAVGWRLAIGGIGMIALLALGGIYLLGRRVPAPPPQSAQEGLGAAFAGTARLLRLRALWPLLPLFLIGYAAMVTVRGLWAGPYLNDVFGLSPAARGDVLLLMAAAMTLSPILAGRLELRMGRQKPIVLVGSALTVGALAALALLPQPGLTLVVAMLVLIGFAGSTYTLLMAHGRLFLPPAQIGRGMTLLNCIGFVGTGLLQLGSGVLVEQLRAAGLAGERLYAILFAVIGGLCAVALLAYLRAATFAPQSRQVTNRS